MKCPHVFVNDCRKTHNCQICEFTRETQRTKIAKNIKMLNCDCIEYMAGCEDNSFDLAIVDPPYGIGAHAEMGLGDSRNGNRKKSKWIGGAWDNETPTADYFRELSRISNQQIIWGGNYFDLPPSRCFLIWDKVQRIDQADCELAWTSLNTSARIFKYARGKQQGFLNPDRFHPTEKPIELYDWLLRTYAKPDQRILDTHLGSGSSAIAAHYFGCDFVGMEIDNDYYKAACERFDKETRQLAMF